MHTVDKFLSDKLCYKIVSLLEDVLSTFDGGLLGSYIRHGGLLGSYNDLSLSLHSRWIRDLVDEH